VLFSRLFPPNPDSDVFHHSAPKRHGSAARVSTTDD